MNFFKKFNKLKNDYKDNNISVVSLLVCLFGVLALTFGTSYAYLSYTAYAEEENYISAGTLLLNFNDNSDAIYMSNAVPQRDQDALENNPEYSFTIRNNGTLNAKYEVRLVNVCNEGIATTSGDVVVTPDVCIPLEYIKVGVKQGDSEYAVASLTNDGKFYIGNGTLDANTSSIEYKIKIWLDERTPDDYQSELNGVTRTVTFVGQLEIYGEQMPTDTYAVGAISLADAIKAQGVVSSGNGLYVSTDTNDGRPTYYYRGAVENNYVQFAEKEVVGTCRLKDGIFSSDDNMIYGWDNVDFSFIKTEEECLSTNLCLYYAAPAWGDICTPDNDSLIENALMWGSAPSEVWKVIRINEDGTIRLILNSDVTTTEYNHYFNLYYSDSADSSGIKTTVENWYTDNLASSYDEYITTNNYCESYKATNGLDSYQADFKCPIDKNGKQYVTAKVGLISLDEALMSGSNNINNTYLKGLSGSTLSVADEYAEGEYGPTSYSAGYTLVSDGTVGMYTTYFVYDNPFNPVINLRGNVTVTGSGTSGDPWVVQTN